MGIGRETINRDNGNGDGPLFFSFNLLLSDVFVAVVVLGSFSNDDGDGDGGHDTM